MPTMKYMDRNAGHYYTNALIGSYTSASRGCYDARMNKLNKSIQKGGSTDFKPDMPWDHIMYLATTDEHEGASEHHWLTANSVGGTTLVVTKVAPTSRYVDGDANVAQTH